jgi:hypothetical protein
MDGTAFSIDASARGALTDGRSARLGSRGHSSDFAHDVALYQALRQSSGRKAME